MIALQTSLILYVTLPFVIMIILILIPTSIGFMMPSSFTLKKSRDINASREVVFFILTNYRNFPKWRKKLQFVDIKTRMDTHSKLVEHYKRGRKKEEYNIVNYIENSIISLVKTSKDYTSLWSFELNDGAKNQTILTIKETIYVYSPYLRFMIRFIFKGNSDKENILNIVTKIIKERDKKQCLNLNL